MPIKETCRTPRGLISAESFQKIFINQNTNPTYGVRNINQPFELTSEGSISDQSILD